MDHSKSNVFNFSLILICLIILSCNHSSKEKKESTSDEPGKTEEKAEGDIKDVLEFAMKHAGKIDDSLRIKLAVIADKFYDDHDYDPVWSNDKNWQPLADSLIDFISQSELYGLFPDDYNLKFLSLLKNKLAVDSLHKMEDEDWLKADIAFTDASLRILKDIKFGRFSNNTFNTVDSATKTTFIINALNDILKQNNLTAAVEAAEPTEFGYQNLKAGIQRFLDSMDRKPYTYVVYPFKPNNEKDSLFFVKTLQKRLSESKCIEFTNKLPDTTQLKASIKKYQKLKGLKQDGLISAGLIKLINTNDVERFKRIAITLDRYKQLPDTMPEKYVWVNLPAYYLELWEHDSVAFKSKVICGKPETRTPLLKSNISNIVTYPTWTVPTSIIAKSYLPKLKSNPNYLTKIGLKLVDSKGNDVDPNKIKWEKYTKGIPYKVMQNSGDDNALGVIKFNFENPYAVYLHDTNQRYLFKKSSRALSHGCVRVQDWEKLAFYIAQNDSINLQPGDSLRYNTDSIKTWISGKITKRISIKNKIPLFINYFSCEGKDGKITFYDDIYGEDKALREKYFSGK